MSRSVPQKIADSGLIFIRSKAEFVDGAGSINKIRGWEYSKFLDALAIARYN